MLPTKISLTVLINSGLIKINKLLEINKPQVFFSTSPITWAFTVYSLIQTRIQFLKPLILKSYVDPYLTFTVNYLGSTNIMEISRKKKIYKIDRYGHYRQSLRKQW